MEAQIIIRRDKECLEKVTLSQGIQFSGDVDIAANNRYCSSEA